MTVRALLRPLAAFALATLACTAGADAAEPLVTEGIVEAPIATVWSAWTTSAGLRSWLAPQAEIELRIGGTMRVNSQPQGVLGDESTLEHRILAYDPQRMLALQVSRAPARQPFAAAVPQMWTVVYFTERGADRTQLRIVGQGFGDDDTGVRMRDHFRQANETTLRQLQARFEKR